MFNFPECLDKTGCVLYYITQMSDHIEFDGRKYYEESYLILANNNGKRRGERIAELEAAIERDRSKMADIVTAVQKELNSRFWLTEGRGSYEWDDDRYRQEFHGAAVAIIKALDPLKVLAADLTDSPRASAEAIAARRDIAAENAELRKELAAAKATIQAKDYEIDRVSKIGRL